jgi:transcriptional regulator with XRE-family HTH domain
MCLDLGLSKSTLSDIKSGRKKGVSTSTAAKIAAYLDVSVGYLLGEEQKEKPTVPEDDGLTNGLSEIDMEIVKKISLLSPEMKQEYASYLTYLLSKQEQ